MTATLRSNGRKTVVRTRLGKIPANLAYYGIIYGYSTESGYKGFTSA